MKNRSNIKLYLVALPLVLFAVAFLASCKKDDEMGGPPVIQSVYVLDTVARHRDSLIVGAEPFTLLVINGSNMSGIQKAYFNEYEATFNTVYNTSTKLIIRVPSDAPTDETATNQIRLVTARGEATYNFRIIAKPTVSAVDKFIFGAGRGDITITGKNFKDMVQVVAFRERNTPAEVVTDSVVCEIISKTEDKLVVRIPENTLSRVTLAYTNTSGTTMGANVFVNADQAYQFFTEDFGTIVDQINNREAKWSAEAWDTPFTVSTDQAYSGQKSLAIALGAQGWKWFGLASYWAMFRYDPAYKYVVFAVKGGENAVPLWLSTNATVDGGQGGFPAKNRIEVPANAWTFYRLAIADLDYLYDGTKDITHIGFRTQGPEKPAQFYIDDFMLVK